MELGKGQFSEETRLDGAVGMPVHEMVDGEYIAVSGVLSLKFPLEDLTIADASDSTWLLFCFRDDCELDLDPLNGLIDLDRMPELELWFEDKIELVATLLLKLGSGTVGLEPTLKALKDFPEPVTINV